MCSTNNRKPNFHHLWSAPYLGQWGLLLRKLWGALRGQGPFLKSLTWIGPLSEAPNLDRAPFTRGSLHLSTMTNLAGSVASLFFMDDHRPTFLLIRKTRGWGTDWQGFYTFPCSGRYFVIQMRLELNCFVNSRAIYFGISWTLFFRIGILEEVSCPDRVKSAKEEFHEES